MDADFKAGGEGLEILRNWMVLMDGGAWNTWKWHEERWF
jgi:hypothetical protein